MTSLPSLLSRLLRPAARPAPAPTMLMYCWHDRRVTVWRYTETRRGTDYYLCTGGCRREISKP